MVTTVRFDSDRAEKLEKMTALLHKKKSEIIREALDYYASYVLQNRKHRIVEAAKKVSKADAKELENWEITIHDGL